MKKIYAVYVLCFFLFNVYGQNNQIVIGKIDTLRSEILNEERQIWIHVPEGNYDGSLRDRKYPVVYLLDGNAHFYSVMGMINQLSSVNGNTVVPKMIVVGIPNTNRMRDLTPTKTESRPASGGGEAFMAFIEKELMPYIDANYPTESYRTFVGHSLGGLTVMNAWLEQSELFDSYVAIDPSMWWNNRRLLNKIKDTDLDDTYKRKSLFLAIANTMAKGMDTLGVQKDNSPNTNHIRSILELNRYLNKNSDKQLSYNSKYYENDSHGSVPLIAEYDAFHHIFDFYNLRLTQEDYTNPEIDFADKIKTHYTKLSEVYKRIIKPSEAYIENFGRRFMERQQFKKAEDLFKLNVLNYPLSDVVYTALGDLYVAKEDNKKAIEYYKKAVVLNKDSSSKRKLEQLMNN